MTDRFLFVSLLTIATAAAACGGGSPSSPTPATDGVYSYDVNGTITAHQAGTDVYYLGDLPTSLSDTSQLRFFIGTTYPGIPPRPAYLLYITVRPAGGLRPGATLSMPAAAYVQFDAGDDRLPGGGTIGFYAHESGTLTIQGITGRCVTANFSFTLRRLSDAGADVNQPITITGSFVAPQGIPHGNQQTTPGTCFGLT